ncbi:MAG TPA: Gfo/Idh/MocA family oxidoreductase [Ramlibacter sp.]|nr:Gfo/Idh/MocA family oxidoreductase [Ramlibacter sp.]
MNDNSKLGVAVFGAGLAWRPHRDSLRDLADTFDVRWLVGRSLARVSEQAAFFAGARATDAIDQVLEDPLVKVALVLTPPNTHLEIVTRLAARGIHVLLEKPLDVDTPRAQALVGACRDHGVKLGVVLQHRMRPAARRLKQLVDDGALGALTNAAVEARWWRPQSYYDEPGRGTRARDGGGVLLTQAVHTLDLFLHLAGPVAEVAAFATTSAAHQMECEDVATAVLRLRGGALATVNATTAAYPGFSERIQISGTLGTATLSGGELSVSWLDGRSETRGEEAALGAGADPMAFAHDAHRALIADFAEAVRSDREPAASGAEALNVHRLIDALLEASAERRVVRLPSGNDCE